MTFEMFIVIVFSIWFSSFIVISAIKRMLNKTAKQRGER